jgi:hypothetical protein
MDLQMENSYKESSYKESSYKEATPATSVVVQPTKTSLPNIYTVRVEVMCREDMEKVEECIRIILRTSTVSRRCQVLGTSSYTHARLAILQWLGTPKDKSTGILGKERKEGSLKSVHHLGEGISMHIHMLVSDDDNITHENYAVVDIDWNMPGNAEYLPMIDFKTAEGKTKKQQLEDEFQVQVKLLALQQGSSTPSRKARATTKKAGKRKKKLPTDEDEDDCDVDVDSD